MIVLASQSPRRRALLEQIGVAYRAVPVAVDETPRAGEAAGDYVQRLARAKALAGRAREPGMPVLGADTAVMIDERILGKPVDRDEALAMLARLSGREHLVYSAVALAGAGIDVALCVSRVTFGRITPAQAAAYWASGEPADKAGAYGIQGRGAAFVRSLQGSYSGVMGLPLFETVGLLAQAGIPVFGV